VCRVIEFSASVNSITLLDYSLSSVLFVVVAVIVGTGYIILGDGWFNLVQIWSKHAIQKLVRAFFTTLTTKSEVKIKDQIFHFTITPKWLDRFLSKFARYIMTIKNWLQNICDLHPKLKEQNQMSNNSFCQNFHHILTIKNKIKQLQFVKLTLSLRLSILIQIVTSHQFNLINSISLGTTCNLKKNCKALTPHGFSSHALKILGSYIATPLSLLFTFLFFVTMFWLVRKFHIFTCLKKTLDQ